MSAATITPTSTTTRVTTLDRAQAQRLLRFARESVIDALGGPRVEPIAEAWAHVPAATFVTLRWRDEEPGDDLQGCIGSSSPRRSIARDVAENAVAAALRDPRARPLSRRDVDALSFELSLLGELEPVAFDRTEVGALATLRRDHGYVLSFRERRGLFLAQVWESLPSPREFLAHLKMKAGLPPDFWDPAIELQRFPQTKYEEDVRPS